MIKRMILAGSASLLVAVFCAGLVAAQEPARPKNELIKELLEVTGLGKQANLMLDTMFDNMGQQFPQMLEMIAETDPGLTMEQRQSLKAAGSEKLDRFTKAFRDKVKQRVDFAKVLEELTFSIYGKYFTESEIKDLIVFYKSPTGKKMTTIMPQILAESMQQTSEKLTSTFTKLAIEVLKEIQ
ncbi:MAG TPA: DUF2059 domain-containing protein [Blastocatellia bacterium]|nr:DUF2059 domain-containing protein [Blastocatellia bacterium]